MRKATIATTTWSRILLAVVVMISFVLTGCDDSGSSEATDRLDRLERLEGEIQAGQRLLQEQREELQGKEALLEEIEDLQRNLQLKLEAREIRLEEQEQAMEEQRKAMEEQRKEIELELEAAKKLRQKLEARVTRGPAPTIVAKRAIAVDASTGDVLFEKNADQKGSVASTQKLLTALLLVEKGELDGEFEIIAEDTRAAPTKLGLEAGEQFTRNNLLTSLLVRSYNDVAEALARDHSGSVEAFSKAMNRRAAELGMLDSHFRNPHGLPDDAQYSTARDMARLAIHVDQQPKIREMVKLHGFTLERPDGREVVLTNTNRVLRAHDWCDGMKTGYTRASGFCLVASGEHEGRRCIVVVLNSTSAAVWEDARKLLAWAIEVD